MNILQDISEGTKRLKFPPKTCENLYENTHISNVIHYETTWQLITASRRNIICCKVKSAYTKYMG